MGNAYMKYETNDVLSKTDGGQVAAVFRGTFQGQPIAVKRIKLANVATPDGTKEEARKKLSHENVLKLLHFETQEDFR